MDNNFSRILDIFKTLDEGSMSSAKHHSTGPKFPGYATADMGAEEAKKHMVGADESIEPTEVDKEKGSWSHTGPWVKSQGKDPRGMVTHASDEAQRTTMGLADKLRARWEETKREKGLQEYGMTTGGTANPQGGTGAAQPGTPGAQDIAKQLTTAQGNLNKLTAAGLELPVGTAQAAKSAVNTASNPGAVQGQGMDATAKKTATALGQELEQVVATGNPSDVQQVANAIKKVNMQQGQQ
jgi:hypothetical protein